MTSQAFAAACEYIGWPGKPATIYQEFLGRSRLALHGANGWANLALCGAHIAVETANGLRNYFSVSGRVICEVINGKRRLVMPVQSKRPVGVAITVRGAYCNARVMVGGDVKCSSRMYISDYSPEAMYEFLVAVKYGLKYKKAKLEADRANSAMVSPGRNISI